MKSEVIDDKTLIRYGYNRDMWLRLIKSARSYYDLHIVMEAIKATRDLWYSKSKSDDSSKDDFDSLYKLADEFILVFEAMMM